MVELVVVITIIVVLLALLAPAMEKAIYQAELAVCGARVRTLAEAATVYAAEHKRAYPYNEGVHVTSWRPNQVWLATGSGNRPIDNRVLIRPYVGSINKQFQCPFLTEMDIDLEDVGTRYAGVTGWGSYQFWYGWQYQGEEGMSKIGDRFTSLHGGVRYAFDVLANDYDFISQTDGFSVGSHPDKEPRPVRFEQITTTTPYAGGVAVNDQPTYYPHIQSRWWGLYQRGPVDMNFAHADCSVDRCVDVVIEQADQTPDPRMVRVPEGSTPSTFPTWFDHLPPVR